MTLMTMYLFEKGKKMWRRDDCPPPYIPPEYRNKKYSEMPPEYRKVIDEWVSNTSIAAGSALRSFMVGATVIMCLIVVVLGAAGAVYFHFN